MIIKFYKITVWFGSDIVVENEVRDEMESFMRMRALPDAKSRNS